MRRITAGSSRRLRRYARAWLPSDYPLGISATGAQEPGDDAGRRNAFDFDKFFDQMLGEQNAEQKQALERIEIPWQEEEQFGRQAADRFLADLRRQGIRVVSRGKDVEYLRSLLETIRPQMQRADRYRHLTVMIAESPGTDARCFPGGIVVVFRGMLECAQNEAALVGVLGHELSHVDHGHQLRYLKSMKLSQSTFAPGGAPGNFPDMMNNVMLLTKSFARPFRPEEEAEADQDGATWAYRAGYDPRELAKLFLRFPQSAGRSKRAGSLVLPFASLPSRAQRGGPAALSRVDEGRATRGPLCWNTELVGAGTPLEA